MKRNNSPRTIIAKFAGKCTCCGGIIKAGELADYYPARRAIGHVGALDGTSPHCTAEIRKRNEVAFVDVDRIFEDQCADICGR